MCVWSKNNPDAEKHWIGEREENIEENNKESSKVRNKEKSQSLWSFLYTSNLSLALTGAFLSLSVILTLT